VALARHGGGFKSDKRRKELLRLQKQEEKRQRRFSGKTGKDAESEEPDNGELTTEETPAEESTKEE
jgi:hypothetical protein